MFSVCVCEAVNESVFCPNSQDCDKCMKNIHNIILHLQYAYWFNTWVNAMTDINRADGGKLQTEAQVQDGI